MGELPTAHLPFPMPSRSHALTQEWRNLTFMHWEVDINKLQPHIPDGLEIDTYDGKAYVGVVPFIMKMSDLDGFSQFLSFRRSQNLMLEPT